ncbi:MAG: outer membrane beta-barrel protein [Gammaproteobacteria bacterium]|nr:outer membrane beta-barrel protein [Gammaproteobacteria bacterium]MDH5653187.1 outer membrane beta-barrel protein [Gammaproteobacteria bacterium]
MIRKTVTTVLAIMAWMAACNTGAAATWDGTYFGVSGGFAGQAASSSTIISDVVTYFNPTDKTQLDPLMARELEATGATLDLFIGKSWQTADRVVGVELGLFMSPFEEKFNIGPTTYVSQPAHTFQMDSTIKSNLGIAIRPRLGYIVNDTLYYGVLGIAFRQFDYHFLFTDTYQPITIPLDKSTWALGYVIGGGMEKKMSGDWLLRADVTYSQYDAAIDEQSHATTLPGAGFDHKVDFTETSLRVGIVKKF